MTTKKQMTKEQIMMKRMMTMTNLARMKARMKTMMILMMMAKKNLMTMKILKTSHI
jgi:hypothetical protein